MLVCLTFGIKSMNTLYLHREESKTSYNTGADCMHYSERSKLNWNCQ